MKKYILLTVLIIGMIANTFGQLSEYAQVAKDNNSPIYDQAKDRAVEKWEDNHRMVVYEINKQIEAMVEAISLKRSTEFDEDIMLGAMHKWHETINGKDNYNWSMVIYEYKKQVKSKNEY